MLKPELKAVVCPECGTSQRVEIWVSVSSADPTLKEKILNGELFYWRCVACGKEARLVYPCLYHDTNRNFMLLFQPDLPLLKTPEKLHEVFFGTEKRVTDNINAFKEKLLIFELGLNDMAVQLTKQVLSEVLERDGCVVNTGYFAGIDEANRRIGFYVFFEGSKTPVYKYTRIESYYKCLEIVDEYKTESTCDGGFLRVDDNWAKEIMKKYLGDKYDSTRYS